ncbi:MAG: outer membrane protein assembly factor BamE [Burkholderiaceae bacterium]|nr:MAG: outer membrane protein assembly factor BamE [Burkholderiaceae bacterium]
MVCMPLMLSACSSAPKQADASTADAGTKIIKPSGISQFFGFISPYRITVQQGNFVSEEMASQLKEGMTREQVRFILGTALLTDMFHEDRWDYPFRLQKPNGEVITSKLAIHFKNNTVEKFERGPLPTEKEYLAQITTAAIATRNENMTPTEPQKKK